MTLGNDMVQNTDTTLLAGAGTAAFTGDLELNDFLLTVDGAGDTVFSGNISAGSGALDMIGSGTLSLTGDAAGFNGHHQVSAGVLSVDGALAGTLDVYDGARLQGSGSVGSTVIHDGAALAPGNSIGALTVNGDLQFQDGAELKWRSTPPAVPRTMCGLPVSPPWTVPWCMWARPVNTGRSAATAFSPPTVV